MDRRRLSSPTGWTQNDDGTWAVPPKALPQNWHDVPENVTRTIIKDGALLIYDSNSVLRAQIGKVGTSFDVQVLDATGANPVKLSTLAYGIQAAMVTGSSEWTSSSSYTDLATYGPEVNVTIGPSGRILVHIGCSMACATEDGKMGFVLSGANTRSAFDNEAASLRFDGGVAESVVATVMKTVLLTGLNPGVTTVTAKYRASEGTPDFADRSLVVEPF